MKRPVILKVIAGMATVGLMAGCLNPGPLGEVTIHDPSGDMRSDSPTGDGEPPGPDLVRVTLRAASSFISVHFESAEPVAEVLSSEDSLDPSWFVRFWSPSYDDLRTPYLMFARLTVGEAHDSGNLTPSFDVYLCDNDEWCSTVLPSGEVRVTGHELEIRVPRRAMPKLAKSFDWSAQAWSFGGGNGKAQWFDPVPNYDADEPPATVRFEEG